MNKDEYLLLDCDNEVLDASMANDYNEFIDYLLGVGWNAHSLFNKRIYVKCAADILTSAVERSLLKVPKITIANMTVYMNGKTYKLVEKE
jgi:hypothetical protein